MPNEKITMTNVLQLYKDMPYLWNKNDKNYMQKSLKEEGYNVLLSVFKTIDEKATTKTLKKKLDNMKTNYFKELKKVKNSKHTGAGSDDIYRPTVWYFDNLSFLESTTSASRSTMDTMESDSMENEESLSCEEEMVGSVAGTSSQVKKRNKKDAPHKVQKEILEKASQLLDRQENDWEVLGRCIGMQLRDLNLIQRTIAQKLISDVLYYGKLNKLSEVWQVSGTPLHTSPFFNENLPLSPSPYQTQTSAAAAAPMPVTFTLPTSTQAVVAETTPALATTPTLAITPSPITTSTQAVVDETTRALATTPTLAITPSPMTTSTLAVVAETTPALATTPTLATTPCPMTTSTLATAPTPMAIPTLTTAPARSIIAGNGRVMKNFIIIKKKK